jgi:hypothetical protein
MNIVVLVSSYSPWLNSNTICIKRILENFPENTNVKILANKGFCSNYDENYELNGVGRTTWVGSKRKEYKHLFEVANIIFSKGSYNTRVVKEYLDYLCLESDNIDVIIPVCFPFETCIAAIYYKEIFDNVIIAPILFDKYANSSSAHRVTLLKKIKFKHHQHLENKLLEISSVVFATSSWVDYLRSSENKFSYKSVKIEHPLINNEFNKAAVLSNEKNDSDKKISFFFAGTLHSKVRTPNYCFDFFDNLSLKQNFNFISYIVGPLFNSLKHTYSSNKSLIIKSSTLKDVVDNEMMKSNFLVVIGNNDISQEQGKIYEYMSTGLPIVYFYKSCDEPIFKKMKLYPHCFMINEKEIMTEQILFDFNDFISNKFNHRLKYEVVANLFPEYTSKNVSNIIFNELRKVYKYVFR